MRSHLHVLTALAFSACSTHEWTTVRVNESLDVREVSPRSLPSSPADAPSATRITLIAADGKTFAVKPGTVYLQEPNFVLFRRYAGTEEVRMMAEDVWAIHFEEFKSGIMSRETESETNTGLIVGVIFGSAVVVGLISWVVAGFANVR